MTDRLQDAPQTHEAELTPHAPERPRHLLLHISIFLSGRAVSSLGDWIYIVALNLLVLKQTGSALAVALVWVVPYLAATLVSPWVGSITDRVNQRIVLIVVDVFRACTIGAIPLVHSIGFIYLMIFLTQSAGVFFGQASLPYRTRLVPEHMRKRVNGLMGTINSGTMLAGPAIAGALMLIGSPRMAIWADALSFVVSAASLTLLPSLGVSIRRTEAVGASEGASTESGRRRPARLLQDWKEAIQFLRTQRFFLVVYGTFAITAMFAQGANSIEVVFAQNALHLGQTGYSIMVFSAGVGVVAGSLIVSTIGSRLSTRWLAAGGLLATQVCYLLYACSIGLWTAVGTLVPLGLFNAFDQVGRQTYIQSALPVERMGRTLGALNGPINFVTLLVMIGTGAISEIVHVRIVMIALTVLSSAVALAGGSVMLRRTNRRHFEESAGVSIE